MVKDMCRRAAQPCAGSRRAFNYLQSDSAISPISCLFRYTSIDGRAICAVILVASSSVLISSATEAPDSSDPLLAVCALMQAVVEHISCSASGNIPSRATPLTDTIYCAHRYNGFKLAQIRASRGCPPTSQAAAPRFALHPCHLVQKGTVGNSQSLNYSPQNMAHTTTMFCSFGRVLARRTPSQIACDDSRAGQCCQKKLQQSTPGCNAPGMIPSSCVIIRNPRNASSSVAATYSALPLSFNQACSGPTPG